MWNSVNAANDGIKGGISSGNGSGNSGNELGVASVESSFGCEAGRMVEKRGAELEKSLFGVAIVMVIVAIAVAFLVFSQPKDLLTMDDMPVGSAIDLSVGDFEVAKVDVVGEMQKGVKEGPFVTLYVAE